MAKPPVDRNAPVADENDRPQGPTRRRFLQVMGLGLAAPTILKTAACGDDASGPNIPLGEQYFPQGIASGDPRPDSVVLWARAADAAAGGDLTVTLLVATNESLKSATEVELTATADNDGVVKVKVSGLESATHYFYQFVYEKDATTRAGSRVARTKTAPAESADVKVRFALASCQDFIGRQYNSYAKMLEIADELDVVIHIGDYIYETTGDLFFQSQGEGTRKVEFSDEAGAIAFLGEDDKVQFYAAQSLSNYRELYKTYRSDLWLQLVHEKVPFVFIWDDHEFSDDSWQDTATYYDGTKDEEHQTARRKNAERANFEFLPSEHGLAADGKSLAIGEHLPVVDAETVIYRDFKFGKHVHLLLTDTRSYRPDHFVPEGVYPGRVMLDHDQMIAADLDPAAKKSGGAFVYPPYVDLDGASGAAYKAAVKAALEDVYAVEVPKASEAEVSALAEAQAVGLWSAVSINTLVADDITGGALIALDVSETSALPRGATWDNLRFSAGQVFARNGVGARYLVEKAHYEALAKAKLAADAQAQSVMGATQEAWLKQAIEGSTATWRFLATSISMTPMIVNPSHLPPSLDGQDDTAVVKAGLQLFAGLLPTPYLLSVDQWDGFPAKREETLGWLRAKPNCVLLSGDIHSFYAMNHGTGSGGANGVVELTGGGISSEGFKGFVRGVVDGLSAGLSTNPAVVAVLNHFETLLQDNAPGLSYVNSDVIGFVAATVSATQTDATFFMAPMTQVTVDAQGDPAVATAGFTKLSFVIKDGSLTAAS